MDAARVVVTGLGAVSPLGPDVAQMWAGLSAGRCGIARIRAFDPTGCPCELAGEVPAYRIQDHIPRAHRKAVKLMCRDIELAVMAAHEAVVGSGLITKGIDPERVNVVPGRMAVNMGAGMIGCDMVELAPAAFACATDGKLDLRKWGRQGLELITPLWLLKYLPNMLACHMSIIHDIQGPSNTLTCGEVSAHLCIGEAAQVVARGSSDVALAGGAETKVSSLLLRQCLLGRATVTSNHAPQQACRPFDADAAGSVFGEGAGVLVLENLEHARRRGARIIAEVVGVGQSQSLGPACAHLEPDGRGLRIAIEKAVAAAGIPAEMLDLVIPHGTGIPQDDRAEAKAIEGALGSAGTRVPVWPIKSMLSTTGAASGALDAIAAMQAMTHGTIPAAINFDRPAEGCRLNIVTTPRSAEVRHALCCGYTHGGQTAALVLRRFDEDATG